MLSLCPSSSSTSSLFSVVIMSLPSSVQRRSSMTMEVLDFILLLFYRKVAGSDTTFSFLAYNTFCCYSYSRQFSFPLCAPLFLGDKEIPLPSSLSGSSGTTTTTATTTAQPTTGSVIYASSSVPASEYGTVLFRSHFVHVHQTFINIIF